MTCHDARTLQPNPASIHRAMVIGIGNSLPPPTLRRRLLEGTYASTPARLHSGTSLRLASAGGRASCRRLAGG